jgi:hypothetical protein
VAQSALLGAAVVVFLTGPVSRRGALFAFLSFIIRPPIDTPFYPFSSRHGGCSSYVP